MKHKLISLFVLLALLLAWMPVQPARAGAAWFVDVDSTCVSSCGGSWAKAYPTLQAALVEAGAGIEIWVAEGVYYPDEGPGQTDNSRVSAFGLKNGVEIYGGFNGTETVFSERDIAANPVILSGDIDKNDVNTDGDFIADTAADIVGNNTYHVVRGSGTDNTAILDGVFITAGLANGTSPHDQGGGIYNNGGSPKLDSVFFIGNRANIGGGMRNASGNPQLTSNIFMNNSADFGGGMANWNSSPSIAGTTFHNNEATNSGANTGFGGGMHNWNSSPVIIESGFGSNDAVSGGGMYNDGASAPIITSGYFSGNNANYGGALHNDASSPIITKVDIHFNTASDQGGGIYNVESSPVFDSGSINDNTATVDGGGIYNYSSNPEIKNTTISKNTAGNKGGGMYNGYSNPVLTNLTMSENEASDGGGLRNYYGEILLKNTLIANSVSGGDCVNGAGVLIHAASGNNLIEDAGHACGLTNGTDGNIVGVDPKLGELWDNGGSTQTHALLAGSPAIDAGDDAICPDTDQRGLSRPWDGDGSGGAACDIGAYEVPSPSPVFADVPVGYWAISHIESLYANGITVGCTVSPLNYCPANPVTRAQMAVFLLKAMYGAAYVPADATGTIFNDVPASNPFAKWIEQLAAEGITGGCGGGNYCPNTPVTREQMAIFLLVAEHGTGYTPPAATGVFADVPADYWAAPWIEQLAAEGITGGCGGGNFCPKTVVTRAQMAVFLVSAFNLP
ncbi:MAG: S-layer homology domain-containing protein [Chloroflexi bacterium]|nr:S-layer homology domain-containing protein [Chloroflexota bacterium]